MQSYLICRNLTEAKLVRNKSIKENKVHLQAYSQLTSFCFWCQVVHKKRKKFRFNWYYGHDTMAYSINTYAE